MSVYNTVSFYDTIRSYRLDAEYAIHPKKQWLASLVSRNKFAKLGTLLKHISSGHTPYKHDMVSGDVDFITVECVDSLFLAESKLKKITREQYDAEFETNRVIQGSLVCTIKRRICKAYPFLFPIEKPLAMNQDVAFLIPKSGISAGYLATYLSCAIGQAFADRQKTEQMNPYLSVGNLAQLPVALLSPEFQTQIEGKLRSGHQLFSDSTDFFAHARQILLSELGLQNWKPRHQLAYVRNYGHSARAHRMDAEHFQPKYEELRAYIYNYPYGYLKMTDLATNSDETVEPRLRPEQEFNYIELADINQVTGTIESANEIKGKYAPSRARMLLRTGDVIASTIQGSLDKVALVSKEYHGAIGSTGFFVLRPRTVPSGYLLTLTKSIIVREQMRCESSGTILAAVPAKSLRNIIVPNIPSEKRDEIAVLVQQSHAVRLEAKMMLEKAKRAVEIAVEEGEDKAMEFIS